MLIKEKIWNAITIVAFAILFSSTSASGDDWPRWMGPNNDGVYRETGIVESIPENGLNVKWQTPVAGGYAGPAVADGRVFVFDYAKESGESINDPGTRASLKGRERLTALDESSGEQLWQHDYDCPYNISYPAGPRCTPTVHAGMVYILGSEGDLKCLKAENGKVVWEQNLKSEFGAKVPIWGFASHPLVDGDLLYTMVGGEGQCVVALDRNTGKLRWKALSGAAGYCPPSIIELGGARQLIVYNPTAVSSLNPVDGTDYWSIPLKPQYDMSISRPMIEGNRMYASGIHTAAVMIQLSTDEPTAKELWRGKKRTTIHSANSTPIFADGVVYGTDCNIGSLMAIDADNGERLWATFEATQPKEERKVNHGTAFVTRIGDSDRYLLFSEIGDLLMARLTREKYESLGRFHILEPTETAFGRPVVWSHPAYANKTAYIRNDKEIVAVDLSQ